jgi:hypothetical protein
MRLRTHPLSQVVLRQSPLIANLLGRPSVAAPSSNNKCFRKGAATERRRYKCEPYYRDDGLGHPLANY